MKRQMIVAAIVLQSMGCALRPAGPAETLHVTPVPEFATNPAVVPVLWKMFGDAGFGHRHSEEAAFVVGNDEGRLMLVRWPRVEEADTALWSGPLPSGIVAIVHTHPNWNPLPSNIDVRTARQSRLPVYVITRTEISRTTGGSPEIVLRGEWGGRAAR
jgi:JAB domain-containing protein similar to deubiquitination enzymes